MTVLKPNDSLTLNLNETFSKSIQVWSNFAKENFDSILTNWETFVKEVRDSMFSLKSGKMTAFWSHWPNENLTFPFHETFSNSIQKWTTFVKNSFLIQWLFLKVTKWLLCDHTIA